MTKNKTKKIKKMGIRWNWLIKDIKKKNRNFFFYFKKIKYFFNGLFYFFINFIFYIFFNLFKNYL
jgi:hypothetical protein